MIEYNSRMSKFSAKYVRECAKHLSLPILFNNSTYPLTIVELSAKHIHYRHGWRGELYADKDKDFDFKWTEPRRPDPVEGPGIIEWMCQKKD